MSTQAERILKCAAWHYVDAKMEQLLGYHNNEWLKGYVDGNAGTSGTILKIFLKDLPRSSQLRVGAVIRDEISMRKATYKATAVAA